jgi:hypothetical protein
MAYPSKCMTEVRIANRPTKRRAPIPESLMSSSPLGCPRVAALLACYPFSPSRGDRLLPFKQTVIQLSILPSRSTYPASTVPAGPLLLTSCSRGDTEGHRTTPDDTGRHVEPGSVPGGTNLRIRCPKGRGSSTPPSRTTSDLRIFSSSLYRRSASEAFSSCLLTRTL